MGHDGSDQVGYGEASRGDAESSNLPDDDEMTYPDVPPLDVDTDFEEARNRRRRSGRE